MLFQFIIFAALLSVFAWPVDAITCQLVQRFSFSGDFSVGAQNSNGVCNEWILGPVIMSQYYLIKFTNVDISCYYGDNLIIYDENRTKSLFNYCKPLEGQQDFLMVQARFVFLQLFTVTSKYVSALFSYMSSGPPTPPLSNCGSSYYKPIETSLRIIGGIETVKYAWPWQVYLTNGKESCGASLLDNQWLITAAHCVENQPASSFTAYLGVHNIKFMESTTITRKISGIYKFPLYIGKQNYWDNDIAVLKMSQPVQFTNEIQPVCLPNQGENLAVIGTIGYITGWGKQSASYFDQGSPVLQQTALSVQYPYKCGINDSQVNMICAGISTPIVRDSCNGDSGGPFVMKVNNNFVLVGIVSWGSSSCNGDGVYTKVSNYVNWIKAVIQANSYYY